MFKNYIKIAWRNLLRHKGYSIIKILGLSVGIACCILIMLFVHSEMSYDKFHAKSDRIYRVWQDEKYEDQRFVNTFTPLIMAPTIEANIPEVEATSRVVSINPMVTLNGSQFTEQIIMVDTTFFQIFDFNLISGNRSRPFEKANSIILSKSSADRFFGSDSALGKTLQINLGNEDRPFVVSGIVEDSRENSSVKYGALISFSNVDNLYSKRAQQSWFNVFGESYVLLKENSELSSVTPKFPAMMKQALGENYSEGSFEVFLQPITEIHLDTKVPQGIQPISDPMYSYILGTIGILILLVACINFIILAIGQSTGRAREVGVRKVMGANRKHLIYQFMGEAAIITFFSLLVGIVLSILFLNPYNTIINRELSIPLNLEFILFCLTLGLIIAFLAGYYPAVILSKFNPAQVIKGRIAAIGGSGLLRKGLIVGQFAASIALIVCSMVIGQQIDYLNNKDLGYDKEQLIVVPTNLNREDGAVLASRYETALESHPEVLAVSTSLYSLAEAPWITLGFTNEANKYQSFQYNTIDSEFLNAMDINLAEGRDFDEKITSDLSSAAIVNEAFVRQFGLDEPIGKLLPGPFRDHQIVGVTEDFNYQSLHTEVAPLLLTMQPDSIFRQTENIGMSFSPQPRITVRMKEGSVSANVELLKNVWQEVAPNQDFENIFLDDSLAARYEAEIRTSTIVQIASMLSIFIALMGLFGLITLTIARRRKEIGVRRVLGAKVHNIVSLLSADFTKLILLASIIAVPAAWWFLTDWLEDFAYPVTIKWWSFAIAGIAALIIGVLTISIQAVKAALSNPVNSLRTE